MVIGLCGYARVGKDSAANILGELAGFQKAGFADALRQLALAIDPYVAPQFDEEPRRYSEVLRQVGYEQAKAIPEVRRYLQRLGSEGVRGTFGADAWVQALHARLKPLLDAHCHIAIADVRFPNEADYVLRQGECWHGMRSELWRIVRPGYGAANAHESETNHERFTVTREIVASNMDELRQGVTAAWQEASR